MFDPLVPAGRSPAVIVPGAIRREPVVDGDEIVPRQVVDLCCTADHRCFDGYHAALFIEEIRSMVESPREHFVDPSAYEASAAAE